MTAVRPLAATRLRGGKTVLEKRTRHVVLYEDNAAAENIDGIAGDDWVKARSGFVAEMGDKGQFGSFARFQGRILAGKVTADAGRQTEESKGQTRVSDGRFSGQCGLEQSPLFRSVVVRPLRDVAAQVAVIETAFFGVSIGIVVKDVALAEHARVSLLIEFFEELPLHRVG
jgi:hypothetical protein